LEGEGINNFQPLDDYVGEGEIRDIDDLVDIDGTVGIDDTNNTTNTITINEGAG